MFDKDLLRRIRNDLPMPITIATLGRDGPPSKWSEGRFRFLCPKCSEMQAIVNPRNNLAHCFCCQTNFNNIDLLMILGYNFTSAVNILPSWLKRHQARLPKQPDSSRNGVSSLPDSPTFKIPREHVLQNSQQFGKEVSHGHNPYCFYPANNVTRIWPGTGKWRCIG